MASLKLYFDKRAQRKDNKKPLKAGITNKNEYTLINLDVFLLSEQWDANTNKVINHPNKLFLNNYIGKRAFTHTGIAYVFGSVQVRGGNIAPRRPLRFQKLRACIA